MSVQLFTLLVPMYTIESLMTGAHTGVGRIRHLQLLRRTSLRQFHPTLPKPIESERHRNRILVTRVLTKIDYQLPFHLRLYMRAPDQVTM